MSFANLLKKKVVKGGVDVIALIDKQCSERTTYDFESVKESLSHLADFVKKDNIEEDELMKLFFDFYLKMYADKKRTKGVFHPSGINSACERATYYEFIGAEESDTFVVRHSPQTQRIFDSGTWWHTYIQMLLWKSGILIKSEAKVRNVRRKLSGHADGVIRLNVDTLLEIKTMNSFSFARGKFKPVPAHETQAGVYARELGLTQICFIYINKDTSELCVHIVPINNKYVDAAYDKMDSILSAVKTKKVPPRLVCKDEDSKAALSCSYCSLCFSTKK